MLATLPLVLLSAVLGWLYLRDRNATASGRLAEAAETIAAGVDEYVGTHRRAVASLAAGLGGSGLQEEASCQPWLERQHALYPGFLTMIVTDGEGRIVAASPASGEDGRPIASAGLSVADREYFRRPRATGRPYISEAFRGRGFGNDVIVAVSAPVLGPQGRFAGIVEGSLDLSVFARFGGVYRRVEDVEAIILDAAGRVVWAGAGEYPPLSDARGLSALAHPPAVLRVEAGGEAWLLAGARSRTGGWTVLVRRPWRSGRGTVLWGSVLTFAGVAAAAALSAFLVHFTSRPLRESERRFRQLVAESFGLICTHDLDGFLLMINPAAAEGLGYTPEELAGRHLREILTPAVRDRFGLYLERVKSGRAAAGTMRVLTRSGEERVWLYRNHTVREKGKEPYVLGNALDITERALTEQERDRFFDMSLEMLCIASLDGYFLQLNRAWEKVLGYTTKELKERPFMELVHPDDLASTQVERRRLRMGGNTVDFENRYLHKDGSWRWLRWRASVSLERGVIYAVARDIEEEKRVERLKSDFVSMVSHELRTPLTSIRGSLGLIAGGVAGQLPQKAGQLVDIASKNCERLVRLINDILDVEKIESGAMGFRFGPMELMPLVEQAVEINRAYAEDLGVELRIVQPADGARVWADADRILQVMTNLLSNAAKFSPRGGTVEIAVQRGAAGSLRVSVMDHGKGIPPEFQPRVFDRFAQADSSSTRQKGGTGLGLSISKAIVERHGGRIGFESEPGVATTFTFELPELAKSWPDKADSGELPSAPLWS